VKSTREPPYEKEGGEFERRGHHWMKSDLQRPTPTSLPRTANSPPERWNHNGGFRASFILARGNSRTTLPNNIYFDTFCQISQQRRQSV